MSDKEIYREITRYIDGDLSESEIENLWQKFVENPKYYKWFETELHLRDLAKDARSNNINSISSLNENKSDSWWKNSKNWIFAVAAVILISFGMQFYTPQEAASLHPSSISKIEIDEMSGTDILRSDDSDPSIIDVEMSRALTLAYEGEADEAASKFKSLLIQELDPVQEAKIVMNLGILYYNSGNFEEARSYFETASQSDEMNKFFNEKAWWFLGNAYLNLEMIEEAREAAYQVYEADGRFENSAELLIQELEENSN